MRFYCLTLQNINSLKGKWQIDFEQLHGIFSILGATGAGKSSLLDALCLAIYGATPRLGKITKADNALMSLGTGVCMAQTELEVKGKRYRFYFGQKRSKGLSTGSLQDPKHEIFVQNKSGNFDLISHKKTQSEKLAVQILGMDFTQFTRSVLLAQGGFAAFLQASSKERGEILEHITGSEIYAHLGKLTHQIYTQKQDELKVIAKQLEDIKDHVSSDTLKQQLDKIRQEHDELSLQVHSLTKALLERQSYDTLVAQKHAQEQNLAQIKQAQTHFALDALVLQNAKNHRLLLPDHEALCALYAQKNQQAQSLTQTLDALERHQSNHKQHCQQKQSASQNHADAEQAYFAWQPTLQAYLSAKTTLQTLAQRQQEQQETLTHTQHNAVQLQEKIHHLDDKIAQTEQNLSSLQPILSKLAKACLALQDYPAKELEHQVQQSLVQQQKIKQIQTKLHQTQAQYQHAQACHHNAHAALSHAQNALIAAPSEQVLQAAQERIFTLEQDQKQLDNALLHEETLQKTQKQEQSVLKALAALKQEQSTANDKLQALKHDYEIAKNTHEHQKQIALLNAQIKALKDALCEGTPCPVCGSTTHPDKSMPKIFLDSFEEQKNQSHAALLAQQSLTQQLKEKADELSLQQKACQSRLGLLHEQLQQALAQINLNAPKEDTNALKQMLNRQKTQALAHFETLKTQYEQHRSQKQAIAQAQTHLELTKLEEQSLFGRLQELTETHAVLEDENKQLRQEIFGKKTQLQALLQAFAITQEQSNALMQALDDLLQPNDNRQPPSHLPALIQSLHKHFYESQNTYQKAQQEQSQLTQQHKLFGQSRQDAKQEQQRHQKLINTQQDVLSHAQATLKDAQKDFEQRFDKDAQAHNQVLYQSLEQTKQIAQEAWQAWQQSHDTLKSLQEQHKTQSQALMDTDHAIAQQQNNFDQKRQSFFATHGDFLAAAVDETHYQHLLHTQDKLNSEHSNALYALEQINQKLDLLPKNQRQASVLQDELEHTKNHLSLASQELGVIAHAYNDALNTKIQSSKIKADIAKRQEELSLWMLLHHLIGSYDGKKYRNFAQGLTLNALLHEANGILGTLSDRYTLTQAPDDSLGVCVIDSYQENALRHSKNLSGGESFLVSLALALGLSAMSSHKTKIDSLFLDEGFGTLDEESLDIALSALNQMHAQGKTIGVISHVPALKERIGQQIWVIKHSGGKSSLKGAGVCPIPT